MVGCEALERAVTSPRRDVGPLRKDMMSPGNVGGHQGGVGSHVKG
jgi:hypothetical protein